MTKILSAKELQEAVLKDKAEGMTVKRIAQKEHTYISKIVRILQDSGIGKKYPKRNNEESNANQSVKTLFGNKSKLEDTEQIIIDLRKMDYIKLMVYCKKRKIKPENLVEDKILEILKEDEKCL